MWLDMRDKPQEECGVFGVFGVERAAAVTAMGLHALQHRGQESCGITTFDGSNFHSERHIGLVGDRFSEGKGPMNRLLGIGREGQPLAHAAIGHVRYSTAGGADSRNIQPIYADLVSGGLALAHNGHLANGRTLRRQLVKEGQIFQSTMDTEVIMHLVAKSEARNIKSRIVDALGQIEGGYALVGLTNKKLIGARDPNGIRPLVIGRLGEGYVLASETCALDIAGAEYWRDVEPGEVIIISADGQIDAFKPHPERRHTPCIFEFVYFSRPDSVVQGRSIYDVRHKMGERLAEENPVEADIVVPVPDSGVPAAIGYAKASGLRYAMGIIRSHYVGRTFIQPNQDAREKGVKIKLAANTAVLKDKRVVLVDDSIVRGTTSKQIVDMVRKAGAKEVHFCSASPAIRHGDYYGVDLPDKDKLIAASKTKEEICEHLGANSIGYLSLEGLYWALGETRNDDAPQFADHVFSGQYPTHLLDKERAENATTKPEQLTFLKDDK